MANAIRNFHIFFGNPSLNILRTSSPSQFTKSLKRMSSSKTVKILLEKQLFHVGSACKKSILQIFFLFIRSSIFFHQTSVLLVCLCPTNIFSLPQNYPFSLCLTMFSFPLYAVLPLLGSKHQITVRNLMILFTGLHTEL